MQPDEYIDIIVQGGCSPRHLGPPAAVECGCHRLTIRRINWNDRDIGVIVHFLQKSRLAARRHGSQAPPGQLHIGRQLRDEFILARIEQERAADGNPGNLAGNEQHRRKRPAIRNTKR